MTTENEPQGPSLDEIANDCIRHATSHDDFFEKLQQRGGELAAQHSAFNNLPSRATRKGHYGEMYFLDWAPTIVKMTSDEVEAFRSRYQAMLELGKQYGDLEMERKASEIMDTPFEKQADLDQLGSLQEKRLAAMRALLDLNPENMEFERENGNQLFTEDKEAIRTELHISERFLALATEVGRKDLIEDRTLHNAYNSKTPHDPGYADHELAKELTFKLAHKLMTEDDMKLSEIW